MPKELGLVDALRQMEPNILRLIQIPTSSFAASMARELIPLQRIRDQWFRNQDKSHFIHWCIQIFRQSCKDDVVFQPLQSQLEHYEKHPVMKTIIDLMSLCLSELGPASNELLNTIIHTSLKEPALLWMVIAIGNNQQTNSFLPQFHLSVISFFVSFGMPLIDELMLTRSTSNSNQLEASLRVLSETYGILAVLDGPGFWKSLEGLLHAHESALRAMNLQSTTEPERHVVAYLVFLFLLCPTLLQRFGTLLLDKLYEMDLPKLAAAELIVPFSLIPSQAGAHVPIGVLVNSFIDYFLSAQFDTIQPILPQILISILQLSKTATEAEAASDPGSKVAIGAIKSEFEALLWKIILQIQKVSLQAEEGNLQKEILYVELQRSIPQFLPYLKGQSSRVVLSILAILSHELDDIRVLPNILAQDTESDFTMNAAKLDAVRRLSRIPNYFDLLMSEAVDSAFVYNEDTIKELATLLILSSRKMPDSHRASDTVPTVTRCRTYPLTHKNAVLRNALLYLSVPDPKSKKSHLCLDDVTLMLARLDQYIEANDADDLDRRVAESSLLCHTLLCFAKVDVIMCYTLFSCIIQLALVFSLKPEENKLRLKRVQSLLCFLGGSLDSDPVAIPAEKMAKFLGVIFDSVTAAVSNQVARYSRHLVFFKQNGWIWDVIRLFERDQNAIKIVIPHLQHLVNALMESIKGAPTKKGDLYPEEVNCCAKLLGTLFSFKLIQEDTFLLCDNMMSLTLADISNVLRHIETVITVYPDQIPDGEKDNWRTFVRGIWKRYVHVFPLHLVEHVLIQ